MARYDSSLLSCKETHLDGATACASMRTFTINDAAASENKTLNLHVSLPTLDTTPPVVSAPSGTVPLGCNPSSVPDDAAVLAKVRASENCSLYSTNVTCLVGGTKCASIRTFTIVVADGCHNKTTNTLVYTWTV